MKYYFYQKKVRCFGYIVCLQGICMEDKKIEVIRDWPKLKSIKDIQLSIGFANFYWRFIQCFSKIATLLTLMLKTWARSSNIDGKKSCASRQIAKARGTKPSSKSGFITLKESIKTSKK